ncbi:MAG: hypothetical protein ACPL1Y_01230 [Thermoplasmata archaeon]
MVVYVALLPALTGIYGITYLVYLLLMKKVAVVKQFLLIVVVLSLSFHALAIGAGMAYPTEDPFLWRIGVFFLGSAMISTLYFTTQRIRSIQEADGLFILIFLLSTTGGILGIKGTVEYGGIMLPEFNPQFFAIFVVFGGIAAAVNLYNLIIARIATRGKKRYRKKLRYLEIGVFTIFLYFFLDAFFLFTGIKMIPLTAALTPVSIVSIGFFIAKE